MLMTSRNDDTEADTPDGPPDSPMRLLILAYTRLFLLPERPDGSKLTIIADFGAYDVRLIEMPVFRPPPEVAPLWIELYDRVAGRVLDSVGCQDLLGAGAATEALVAEAERLNFGAPPRPAGSGAPDA
jgi:hypothetical protein